MKLRSSTAVALVLLAACATTPHSSGLVSSSPPAPGASASVTVSAAGTASASPAVTVSPFSSHVRPSPTPTYTGSRTLVESDSGATIKLKVGDLVNVSLPSEYDPPTAQGSVLTRQASTGGYPTGQRLEATFRATSTGRTDVTSSTDYACLHTQPMCMIPQRLWIVHVIVS